MVVLSAEKQSIFTAMQCEFGIKYVSSTVAQNILLS